MRVQGYVKYGKNGTLCLDHGAWPLIRGEGMVKLTGVNTRRPSSPAGSGTRSSSKSVAVDLPTRSKVLLEELVSWRASLEEGVGIHVSAGMLLEVVSFGQIDAATFKSILDPNSRLSEQDLKRAYAIVQKARGAHAAVDPLALISF
jgi:hypothetical protein